MNRVYTYTRVSTSMQVEGYSLDAQEEKIKQYAALHDLEIVKGYVDAGRSGKSVEGRLEFNQMLEDIKSGKDNISYVLVYKLSRFGRNAADVLNTLQLIEDYGVALICVEDNIDSSKGAGKLIISVLSAVSEIERENILVQTLEGRYQKAREGKWNGGIAPYGYKLVDGSLVINEEEAKHIRLIFDKYVNTKLGANGVSNYLYENRIKKLQRGKGSTEYFSAETIKRIIENQVYKGFIAYGRRRKEKVKGTRNQYTQVFSDDYLLCKGEHEAIISEELWDRAQVKMKNLAKKYEQTKIKDREAHLLTGILKCPVCGANMYSARSRKVRKDGVRYKDFNYYSCKHRVVLENGEKCNFSKQINEEVLNGAVEEIIIKMIKDKRVSDIIKEKINIKVDTDNIDLEIKNYINELKANNKTKNTIIDQIESLNTDDKYYDKMKADFNLRLQKSYDAIDKLELKIKEAKEKKLNIEKGKTSAENIYKLLINFNKLYEKFDDYERKELLKMIISEINVYKERRENGQWLKSIKFRLPVIEDKLEYSLENCLHDDT